jgi:hypothetical protein
MLPFSIRQAHEALSPMLLQRGAAIRSGGTIARQLTSTRWQICFAQILLKKSKIENSEESREGRFLVVYLLRLERGLLPSTCITRLPRYYEPIRLRTAPGLAFTHKAQLGVP